MKGFSKLGWAALALLGAFCLGTVALRRGEHINALWIVVAAVSLYLVAYRFYSLFIANKVMQLDPTRATPAWRPCRSSTTRPRRTARPGCSTRACRS